MYVRVSYVNLCICVCNFLYVCMHVCAFGPYVCMYVCVYVCMCMCMCVASFFAELRKLGDKEARHIVSRGLLCEEPSAGLLADVEHRLAAAREYQKKANQRVAVHYSLWEQAKQFTKSTGVNMDGERDLRVEVDEHAMLETGYELRSY